MTQEQVKYLKLLEKPSWIKKRQKILDRDGNKCTVCGSIENLRVHHTFYYIHKVNPWNYPDESLLTVCKSCHEDYHMHFDNVYKKNPIKKQNKNPWPSHKMLTELEKMTLNYYEVETTSRSGKSLGSICFYAKDIDHVRNIMKQKHLPIFNIRKINKQK